jgi:hypothetical protein
MKNYNESYNNVLIASIFMFSHVPFTNEQVSQV